VSDSKRDYYEILGVTREADASELKRSYRKLALELHPDRNPGNKESEARFKEASEAYGVLSDPEKRGLYDRFGHDGPRGGGFSNVGDIFSAFSDIFGDVFGGGMGGRGGGRGSDLETEVELTLGEVATGVTKEITLRRRAACQSCKGSGSAPGAQPERCPQCQGRGQVVHSQGFLMISTTCPMCRGEGQIVRSPCAKCQGNGVELIEENLQVAIPAGVEEGSTLRLSGRGESSARGGRAGHLYVVIRVQPDARFERDGADLHTEVPISFPQAALGDKVNAPTLEGETEVTVAAGTQSGDTVVLRGKGLPRLQERGTGDLVVHLKLVVPTALTKEQEDHLRAFAAGGQREERLLPPPQTGRQEELRKLEPYRARPGAGRPAREGATGAFSENEISGTGRSGKYSQE
jgi:molecular chaperone DnaJ